MFVPGNTQYGIWLRAPSSSGGKDWLGFLTDREVISQWGKTGQVNQSKTISDRPSRIDLDKKIEEKKGKGLPPGRGMVPRLRLVTPASGPASNAA